MTPLRFSMLTATLLAFAATVHGQTLPEPTSNCPAMSTWFAPYLQQSMQTWQQVRGFCTGQTGASGVCGSVAVGVPGCCKAGSCAVGSVKTVPAPDSCCCAKACGCCESCKAKKDATPVQACPAPSYLYNPGTPVAQHVQKSQEELWTEGQLKDIAIHQAERDLKIAEFYQRTGHPGAAQFYYELVMRRHGPVLPSMPAPHQTVQFQAAPMPCPGPVAIALPFDFPHAQSMPVPPPPPMARQVVQIHAIPAPPMIVPPSCSYQPAGTLTPDYKTPCCNNTFALTQPQFGGYQPGAGLPVVECVAAPAVKHVHLVTPDLEAHAARMTQRGDTIILEGDVILLNKKHAQPIRIEAQRAIINMKDGSVTVEGSGSISNFGMTRTSGVETVPVDNRQFQAICLRNSQAVDLAKVLNDAVPKSPFLRPKVDVLAEAISNSVLISGSPHWVEILARFVADLDRAAAPPIVLPTGFGR